MSRRGRPVEAQRRWQTAVSLTDADDEAGVLSVVGSSDHAGHVCRTSATDQCPQRYDYTHHMMMRNRREEASTAAVAIAVGGDDGCGGDGDAPSARQILRSRPESVAEPNSHDLDDAVIPTGDLGEFVATLVDGMRSDGLHLAESAKHVVANTFSVSETSTTHG